MGFKKDLRDILTLLNNHKQLIFKQIMRTIPANYAQLQQAAILKELDDEIEKLLSVFSEQDATLESLKSSFQKLCTQRDKENQNTCMSYTALPEGVCNRLYLDIASIVFKPTQLDEIIPILMPDIKACLIVDISDFLSPKTASPLNTPEERVQMTLQNLPLTVLSTYPFQPSMFSNVITHDNVIIMLERIKKFPLTLHHKFYKLLTASYPEIGRKLYKHNDDLKQLLFDIGLIEKNGKTPNEVLTHFVNELIRSGSRYTGNEYAAESVIQACLQFRTYLDQLPQQFRDEVLALQATNQKTSLLAILDDYLAKGQCVETAAGQIKSIQENQRNIAVLKKVPFATEEQLNLVKQKYHKTISITGYDDTKALPESLQKELLKHIKINSTNDYIDLFLNLPSSEYHVFLTDAKIVCYPALPVDLGSAIEMLDEEQKVAFLDAIINQHQKFGGIQAILKLCINIKITDALENAIKRISPDNLAKIIRNNKLLGHALLHEATRTGNLEILHIFLKCLSEQDRLTALQEKNREGWAPIHYAAQNTNPDIFRTIWSSLSIQDQAIVANVAAYNGSKLLQFAAQKSHPEIWQTIWYFHSREEQLEAINGRNQNAHTLLHFALQNSDSHALRSILERSPSNLLAAVMTEDYFLHRAIQKNPPDFFYIIWKSLTEEERLTVANIKNRIGSSLLHYAAQNSQPEAWKFIWNFYSKEQRLLAIKENKQKNHALLDWALKNPNIEVLRTILEFLPNEERLDALVAKDKNGSPFLHLAIQSCSIEAFNLIWGLLTQKERLIVANAKTSYGSSLLHFAAQKSSPEMWKIIWDFSSDEDRLKAIKETNTENNYALLYCAAQNHNPDVLQSILEFLPEKDRLTALLVKSNDGFCPLHWVIKNYNKAGFDSLWEYLSSQDRVLAIQEKNQNQNLLQCAADTQPAILYTLLQELAKQDRAIAALEPHSTDGTLLNKAANWFKYEAAVLLWESLSEQERLDSIQVLDSDGNTLFHRAFLHRTSTFFRALWMSLSEQNRSLIINARNKNGDSLLHYAILKNKEEIFGILWKSLSKEEKLIAIQKKNNSGKTLLFLTSQGKPQIFNIICEDLTDNFRSGLLQEIAKDDTTMLHLAAKHNNTRLFLMLWQNIAPEDRLSAVQAKTSSGETLLHFAAQKNDRSEILRKILEDLSESDRLAAIRQKDNNDKTAVHWATLENAHNCLFTMLDFLSADEKRLVMQDSCNEYATLHHAIINNCLAASSAILSLSQQDRLVVVLENSKDGYNIFHRAIHKNSGIFYLIWKSLSRHDRLIAAKSRAMNGSGALQFAAQHSTADVWQTIWNVYSDQERRIAIKEKTSIDRYTLLHWAVQNTIQSPLHSILEFLSLDLVAALSEEDGNGNTPLHLALTNGRPDVLCTILKSLSEQERLAILKVKDKFGNTLLHHAAKHQNPEIWFTMIECLPEKDRLSTATEMSACGYTPLQKATENTTPEILLGILKLYPESERIEAIEMLEAWGRRNCLAFNYWNILCEEKEKIQATMATSPSTIDVNASNITPKQSDVSRFGIFSHSQSEISISKENLTPLQCSLLEGFSGFGS